jgi:outer membrane protein insertion porin family
MNPTSQFPHARARTAAALALGIVLLLCPSGPLLAAATGLAAAPSDSTAVSEILVEGNERTRTFIILREMQTRVGGAYDADLVRQDRDRIDNLDLFSEVVIDTLRQGPGMQLRVRVRERLSWLPTEWIPYPVLDWNDETGWTYGLGLTNPNESGRNRSFSILAEGGGRRVGLFSYSDPWIVGNHGSAAVSFFLTEYDDYEGRTNRWSAAALTLGTHLGTWGRARLSFEAAEIETDAWRTASGGRRDRIRSVPLGLAYDTRDVYSDPRSGLYVGGSVEPALPVLDATVEYVSYRLDVRKFRTLFPRQALALGTSVVFRDRAVPDYRRVRLGGIGAVRGLNPITFKGRNRILGSVEYRLAVKEKKSYDFWFIRNVDLGWMLVAFVDAGALWDGGDPPAWDEFYGSVGGGFRILSQQVVRFEAAYSRRDGMQWILATGMPF